MATQTKTEKPKKLFEESELISYVLGKRKELLDKINEFSRKLKSEEITLSQEILQLFIEDGPAVIEDLLCTQVRENLERLKIRGELVMQNLVNEASDLAQNKFSHYQNSIQSLLSGCGIAPGQVTIGEQGTALLTKEEEQEIREQFTYYLTEETEQLHTRLMAFTKHFDELFHWLIKEGHPAVLDQAIRAALTQPNHEEFEGSIKCLRRDTYLINEVIPEGTRLKLNPAYFHERRPSKAFNPSPRDEKTVPAKQGEDDQDIDPDEILGELIELNNPRNESTWIM